MDEVIELERLEKAYQREYCSRLESRINYYKKGLKTIMVDAMPKTRKKNHIVSKVLNQNLINIQSLKQMLT
jgi:hypothetical protein